MSQIYSDSDDTFALGSSQYSEIYQRYREFKMFTKTKNISKSYHELECFLVETVEDLGDMITTEAKQWEETPVLDEWNRLHLKIKLLQIKDTDRMDLALRSFQDLFSLLKNQAWDLWTALSFCNQRYIQLREYVSLSPDSSDLEGDKSLGLMIYFFSEKFDLTDKEVKKIFGGFDT